MLPEELKPNHWYWIRREDGSLAPYRFHRTGRNARDLVAGFGAGSVGASVGRCGRFAIGACLQGGRSVAVGGRFGDGRTAAAGDDSNDGTV